MNICSTTNRRKSISTVAGPLRPRRDVPVPLQPAEPVDGDREVQAGRHHVLHRGVDRGAERALRRLALHPAVLVLPLLPGEVQEVPGTGRPRREGVSVYGPLLYNNLDWDILNFFRFEVDDPDAQQDPPY